MVEQLSLELEFGTPDPLPRLALFGPVLGALQAPAGLFREEP